MIAMLSSFSTQAQSFYNTWYYNYDLVWEAGSSAGIMNCLTDLGGRKGNGGRFLKDIRWSCSRPSFSFYVGATYRDVCTIRFNYLVGSVNAADSQLKTSDPDPGGRYGRNLSFRSGIHEVSLIAEMHPLFWGLDVQEKIPTFSPYFLAGISYYRFNPQALWGDRWHDLQPLRLEGQGFPLTGRGRPYRLRQFAIPVGLGIRYETGPLINIRFDLTYRFLFTDYLDDVSTIYIDPIFFDQYLGTEQASLARTLHNRSNERVPGSAVMPGSPRGNAKNKDAYFSFQFALSYVFRHKVK
jgi:hypothetical protein